MGPTKRHSKTQPFLTFAKGFIALSTLLVSACQSGSKKVYFKNHPEPPKEYQPAEFIQLTFEGSNSQPRFSNNGQQLIYVSQNRAKHTHKQVYSMRRSDRQERRLTFQDGTNDSPQFFMKDTKIVYASSTDEVKEAPPHKDKNVHDEISIPHANFAQFEIYSSYVNGSRIKRLTKRRGFDGTPQVFPKTRQIFFSRHYQGQFDLYRMNYNGKKRKKLTSTKTHELQPRMSPNADSIAFVRYDPMFKSSKIVTGNVLAQDPKIIFDRDGFSKDPSWHPDGKHLLFVYKSNTDKNFEIYSYDFDLNCTHRLTYLASAERSPTFSPDGTKIIYSSNLNGDSHLFEMPFLPPKTCLPL